MNCHYAWGVTHFHFMAPLMFYGSSIFCQAWGKGIWLLGRSDWLVSWGSIWSALSMQSQNYGPLLRAIICFSMSWHLRSICQWWLWQAKFNREATYLYACKALISFKCLFWCKVNGSWVQQMLHRWVTTEASIWSLLLSWSLCYTTYYTCCKSQVKAECIKT